MIIVLLGLLAVVSAGSNSDNKDSFKNQFRGHNRKHKGSHDVTNFSTENCTDPRTMKKHPAYTEWADAYSCTRHRCQPGGRNLAIYTVGCKRVEAPESAIECEEVVEDTNMQFPFCCTRLRCLVVVRGEVWTRVLGQPWEVLPAAPWSHMYKMKKPPPDDTTFIPKTVDQGPIYELTDNESGSEQGNHDKVLLRTGKNTGSGSGDQPEPRNGLPSPDIVIALSTNIEGKESSPTQPPEASKASSRSTHSKSRHNKRRLQQAPDQYFEEDVEKEKEKQVEQVNLEIEELPTSTEKPIEEEGTGKENEKEKFFGNSYNNYPVTEKPSHKSHRRENTPGPLVWTEIPIGQWNEPKEGDNLIEPRGHEHHNNENNNYEEPQLPPQREPKHEALQIPAKKETTEARDTKPNNLQALVDAIGSRMRDIESVVQKMSDKVQLVKTTTEGSAEKRSAASAERDGSHKQHAYKEYKRPSSEDENYKRFSLEGGTKYLHRSTDSATEKPLFIGDFNVKGYFSDASNSILRRSQPKPPKEPPPTYMAPVVEKHRKAVEIEISEPSDDSEKKHKKHAHKKKRTKGAHIHKKRSRSKEDRRKHFNKLSAEAEKNAVSVDDSSGLVQ